MDYEWTTKTDIKRSGVVSAPTLRDAIQVVVDASGWEELGSTRERLAMGRGHYLILRVQGDIVYRRGSF